MIQIPFPMSIGGALEDKICDWVGTYNSYGVALSEKADYVEFKDVEFALVFKLTFGL